MLITYFIYKQFNFPQVDTYTQDDYNWKQKVIVNKFYKKQQKKKKTK